MSSTSIVEEVDVLMVTLLFDICVNVIVTHGAIRILVMGNIIDIPFRNKGRIDNPRSVRYDFVYPAAMPSSFAPGEC